VFEQYIATTINGELGSLPRSFRSKAQRLLGRRKRQWDCRTFGIESRSANDTELRRMHLIKVPAGSGIAQRMLDVPGRSARAREFTKIS